jgi:hypothetical protein
LRNAAANAVTASPPIGGRLMANHDDSAGLSRTIRYKVHARRSIRLIT